MRGEAAAAAAVSVVGGTGVDNVITTIAAEARVAEAVAVAAGVRAGEENVAVAAIGVRAGEENIAVAARGVRAGGGNVAVAGRGVRAGEGDVPIAAKGVRAGEGIPAEAPGLLTLVMNPASLLTTIS